MICVLKKCAWCAMLTGSWWFHASLEMSTCTTTPFISASTTTFQRRITRLSGQRIPRSSPPQIPCYLRTTMYQPACLRCSGPVIIMTMTSISASAITTCCRHRRRVSDPPATSTPASRRTVPASRRSCPVDRCRPAVPVSGPPSHLQTASV